MDESAKERLNNLKQDSETREEFPTRVVGEHEPNHQGHLSEEALDEIENTIAKGR